METNEKNNDNQLLFGERLRLASGILFGECPLQQLSPNRKYAAVRGTPSRVLFGLSRPRGHFPNSIFSVRSRLAKPRQGSERQNENHEKTFFAC